MSIGYRPISPVPWSMSPSGTAPISPILISPACLCAPLPVYSLIHPPLTIWVFSPFLLISLLHLSQAVAVFSSMLLGHQQGEHCKNKTDRISLLSDPMPDITATRGNNWRKVLLRHCSPRLQHILCALSVWKILLPSYKQISIEYMWTAIFRNLSWPILDGFSQANKKHLSEHKKTFMLISSLSSKTWRVYTFSCECTHVHTLHTIVIIFVQICLYYLKIDNLLDNRV